MIEETEFCLSHFYRVRLNPAGMEEELSHYVPDDFRQESTERMHRMYEAILAFPQVTLAVMQFIMILEHDTIAGDTGYQDEQYGENSSLLMILRNHAQI